VERPRRLARFASAAAGALLLAGTATACSSGPLAPGPAATVNGVEISRQQVLDRVETNLAFYRSAEEAQLQGDDFAALADGISGAGEDTLSRAETTDALLSLVRDELVRQELEAADAVPTDEEVEAVRTQLLGGLDQATVDQLDADYIDEVVEQRAQIQALQQVRAAEADAGLEDPDPAAVEAQRDARYAELVDEQPYCLALLQTSTEAESQAALDRIEAGEDFGAVATELSTLTQAQEGGFAGCGDAERVEGSFPGIEVDGVQAGDVQGPVTVADQAGAQQFLLIQFVGVEGPTREQAAAQLEAEIPATAPTTDPASFDDVTLTTELGLAADI
jgi:peptidyl-prolyl cis-trans isomerase C